MANLNLFLFISIFAPLAMMLFIFNGKSRKVLIFLMAGVFICLFSGELNGLLIQYTPGISQKFYSVNVSPLIEEILKAIPIYIYAFMLRPKRQTLLECSIAVGVGFAILENAFILANASEMIGFSAALIRGFGAGMMHGITCLIVGLGITFIYSHKRLFYPGSIALLNLAAIIHSVYNALAQSDYQIAGFLLPAAIFVPLIIFGVKTKKEYMLKMSGLKDKTIKVK